MPVFVPERRRSARGELRVESLLQAAGKVFGRLGYHAATTNAIAAEAKVSPATLYQFFPNKEAIADALAACYSTTLERLERAADIASLSKRPLVEAVSRINEVVIEFHQKNPAFLTLLMEAPLSKDAMNEKHRLSQTFIECLAELLVARNPKISRAEALWNADVCLTVLKGFLPLVSGRKTAERTRSIESLNQVVVRFLEPLVNVTSKT
jgi:AcrR family transcriptional regulator